MNPGLSWALSQYRFTHSGKDPDRSTWSLEEASKFVGVSLKIMMSWSYRLKVDSHVGRYGNTIINRSSICWRLISDNQFKPPEQSTDVKRDFRVCSRSASYEQVS